LVLIVGLSLASWLLTRRWGLALSTGIGVGLIFSLGYGKEAIETLVLVGLASALSLALGLPLGILAAKYRPAYQVLRPILDMMQTLPTFVYLIPALMLFGLGFSPGLLATLVFVLPVPIRMSYLGLSSVPRSLRELGPAFGASPWQSLWKIELPYAWPTIRTGISQSLLLGLSMVVISALVGADGLGKPVVQALNTVDIGMGLEAGLAIVILAMLVDRTVQPQKSETWS
jgi:glycine betaine/proline transport system permease protein